MKFLTKLFKKDHTARLNVAINKKASELGDATAAYYDIVGSHTFSFAYTIHPNKDIKDLKEQVCTEIDKIIQGEHFVKEESPCTISDYDDGSVAFHFFVICIDFEEVKDIEDEIENALDKIGASFKRAEPKRCEQCGAARRSHCNCMNCGA